MKKTHSLYFKIICSLIIFSGCVPSRNNSFENSTVENARRKAIVDFLSRNSQMKTSDAFQLDFLEVPGFSDYYVFRISRMLDTFCINPDILSEYKKKLPSKSLEMGEKLFFWSDSSFTITDSTLSLYKKFGIAVENKYCTNPIIHGSKDDKAVNAHYFFCKNNLKKFKVKFTHRFIGSYNVRIAGCSK